MRDRYDKIIDFVIILAAIILTGILLIRHDIKISKLEAHVHEQDYVIHALWGNHE